MIREGHESTPHHYRYAFRIALMIYRGFLFLLLGALSLAVQAEEGNPRDSENTEDQTDSSSSDKSPFTISIEQNSLSEQTLALKLVFGDMPHDSWVSDANIYWLTPDGDGLNIPLRSVTDDILAAAIEGPLQPGAHKLLVSLALRDETRFIHGFFERNYELNVPGLDLTAGPWRKFVGEAAKFAEPDVADEGKGLGHIIILIGGLLLALLALGAGAWAVRAGKVKVPSMRGLFAVKGRFGSAFQRVIGKKVDSANEATIQLEGAAPEDSPMSKGLKPTTSAKAEDGDNSPADKFIDKFVDDPVDDVEEDQSDQPEENTEVESASADEVEEDQNDQAEENTQESTEKESEPAKESEADKGTVVEVPETEPVTTAEEKEDEAEEETAKKDEPKEDEPKEDEPKEDEPKEEASDYPAKPAPEEAIMEAADDGEKTDALPATEDEDDEDHPKVINLEF